MTNVITHGQFSNNCFFFRKGTSWSRMTANKCRPWIPPILLRKIEMKNWPIRKVRARNSFMDTSKEVTHYFQQQDAACVAFSADVSKVMTRFVVGAPCSCCVNVVVVVVAAVVSSREIYWISILRTARFQFRLTFAVYGPVASDHSSFTWWTLYCFFERGPFDRKRYTGCTGFGLRQKVLLRFDLIFRGGFPLYLQLAKKKTRYSVSCFFLFSILTNTLRFSAKTKNLQ